MQNCKNMSPIWEMISPVLQWKWQRCAHSAPGRPGCSWGSYSPVQLCLWPGQRYSTLPSYQFSALHGLLEDREILKVCKYKFTKATDPTQIYWWSILSIYTDIQKQRPTFGVNIHSQNLSLFWDTKLFRCALKTIRNFWSATSFDHL